MGFRGNWCVGYRYLRKAISMWLVYVNKVMERDKMTKGREKSKIPAGTQSHQGGLPGGERIKKKVIDIHFNPQLTTCHPIFHS